MRANTLTPFDSSAAVRRSSVVAKSCELCSVTNPSSGTANILVGAEQSCVILQVFASHAEEPHASGSCSSARLRAACPFLTMSNSAVVLRSRGALLRPGFVLVIASIPLEGWAERRQAHYLCCRVCETRRIRAGEARRVP